MSVPFWNHQSSVCRNGNFLTESPECPGSKPRMQFWTQHRRKCPPISTISTTHRCASHPTRHSTAIAASASALAETSKGKRVKNDQMIKMTSLKQCGMSHALVRAASSDSARPCRRCPPASRCSRPEAPQSRDAMEGRDTAGDESCTVRDVAIKKGGKHVMEAWRQEHPRMLHARIQTYTNQPTNQPTG